MHSFESLHRVGSFPRRRGSRGSSSNASHSKSESMRKHSEVRPPRMPVGTFSAPGASMGMASSSWTRASHARRVSRSSQGPEDSQRPGSVEQTWACQQSETKKKNCIASGVHFVPRLM